METAFFLPCHALKTHPVVLEIARKFAEDPEIKQSNYRLTLSDGYHLRAILQTQMSSATDSWPAYEAALELREQLHREFPSIVDYESLRNGARENYAVSLYDNGRREEAIRMLEANLTSIEVLIQRLPEVTTLRAAFARQHNHLGRAMAESNRLDASFRHLEQARDTYLDLLKLEPRNGEFRDKLALCYLNLGIIVGPQGNSSAAVENLEKARDQFAALSTESPQHSYTRFQLARCYNSLGACYAELGQETEALEALEISAEIREKLVADEPNVLEFQNDLARSLTNIHSVFRTRDPQKSRAALQKLVTIRTRLAEANATNTQFQQDIAGMYQLLADSFTSEQAWNEAATQFQQAIDWEQRALASAPQQPEIRASLKTHFQGLLRVAIRMSDRSLENLARKGISELHTSTNEGRALQARVAEILAGSTPMGPQELLHLAQQCYLSQQFAHSVRFFAEAVEREPTLMDDRRATICETAAASAVLAAAQLGTPPYPTDSAAQSHLRIQGYDWLRSELNRWKQLVESNASAHRVPATLALQRWLTQDDLSNVRRENIDQLPESERQAWSMFWQEVETQLTIWKVKF